MGGFDLISQKKVRILPGQLLTALFTLWLVPMLIIGKGKSPETEKIPLNSNHSKIIILNPNIDMEFEKLGISEEDNLYFKGLVQQKNEQRISELNRELLNEMSLWSRQNRPVIRKTDLILDLNRDGRLNTQDFMISVRLMELMRENVERNPS